MTINATAIILLALYVAVARRQGVPRRSAVGHDAERHPQGIRRARHLHLPAARRRCASSPTSSRSASASCRNWNTISISGYHIREAGSTAVQEVAFTFANAIAYVQAAIDAGLDVNQLRPAAVVLLQRAQRLSRGDRQVPRGAAAVGADHARPVRRDQPARAAAALPHADRRQHADRAAARQQHRPRRAAGAGRGARRHAVAALQRPRRGAGAADRGIGAHRAAHAADHRRARPASPTPSIRSAASYAIEDADRSRSRRGARRCSTRIDAARRHAGGDRDRAHPARDPGVGLPRAAARSTPATAIVVGVNRFADAAERARRSRRCSDRSGDRARPDRARARRARQPRRSRRGERRSTRVTAAARDGPTTWCRRSSRAVEAHATVGEIADAMRAVFGEYQEIDATVEIRRSRLEDRVVTPIERTGRSDSIRSARLEHLTTVFDLPGGAAPAVDRRQLSRSRAGETLGLVGESGSGKSVTALSIMRLVQPPGPHRRRARRVQGPRSADARRARDAGGARRRDRADLPGADDGAQPGLHDRRSDRGDAARARPRDAAATRAAARDRAARRRCSIPDAGSARRATIRTSSPAACASAC